MLRNFRGQNLSMTKNNIRILMLFLLFYYFSSLGVHAIICPSSLYFYVVQTTDSREVFSYSRVSSFEECIRKCYSSDFCFSSIYTPTGDNNGSADCRLSYVSAFNCTYKTLASVYNTPNRPAIAECIRCPSLGEYVSRPPDSNILESHGNDIDPKPDPQDPKLDNLTASDSTIATANNSNNNLETSSIAATTVVSISPSESASSSLFTIGSSFGTTETSQEKEVLTFEISPVDDHELSEITHYVVNYTDVDTVAQCARACFDSLCSYGLFQAKNETYPRHVCYFIYNATTVCTGTGRLTTYEPAPNQTRFTVQCIYEKSSCLDGHPEHVTSGHKEETFHAEETRTTFVPLRLCDQPLSFQVQSQPMDFIEVSNHSEARSVEECAKHCFQRGCTRAGYAPVGFQPFGSCFFSYQYGNDSNNCDKDQPIVTSYSVNSSDTLEIKCITCGGYILNKEQVINVEGTTIKSIEGQVSQISEQLSQAISAVSAAATTVVASETQTSTLFSTTSEQIQCSTRITFLPVPPAPGSGFKFPSTSIVGSAAECAQSCYVQQCSTAGYIPINKTAGNCMLAYETPKCSDQVKFYSRTDNYHGDEPVILHCLECETAFSKPPEKQLLECPDDGLSFVSKKPDYSRGYNFNETEPVQFWSDCVKMCYSRRCSWAYFLKSELNLPGLSPCSLAYDSESCEIGATRSTNYTGPYPVEFHCIRCGQTAIVPPPFEQTVKPEVIPSSAEKETSGAPTVSWTTLGALSTTASVIALSGQTTAILTSGPAIVVNECSAPVMFQVLQPDPSREVPFNLSLSRYVQSASECAALCYNMSRCTVAGYLPYSFTCVFAFDQNPDCTNVIRMTHFDTKTPVQLQCFSCSAASGLPPTGGFTSTVSTQPPAVYPSSPATEGPYGPVVPESTSGAPVAPASYQPNKHNESKAEFTDDCVVFFQVNDQVTNLAVEYKDHEPAASASNCAVVCYLYGCTLAHYTPSLGGTPDDGVCRLYYEPVESQYACSGARRDISVYESTQPVQLQCVRCIGSDAIPLQPKSTRVQETSPTPLTTSLAQTTPQLVTTESTTIAQTSPVPVNTTSITTIATTISVTQATESVSVQQSTAGISTGTTQFWETVPGIIPGGNETSIVPNTTEAVTSTVPQNTTQAITSVSSETSPSAGTTQFWEMVPGIIPGANETAIPQNTTMATTEFTTNATTEQHFEVIPGVVSIRTRPPGNETAESTSSIVVTLVPQATSTPGLKSCDKQVQFDATVVHPNTNFTFDVATLSASVSDCAKDCYARSCKKALFIPSAGTPNLILVGECRLSFTDVVECPPYTSLVSRFQSPQSTFLKCVTCGEIQPEENVTEEAIFETETLESELFTSPLPAAEENVTNVISLTTSSKPADFPDVQDCQADLSYNFDYIGYEDLRGYNFSLPADNADQCSKICYKKACKVAVFVPGLLINRDKGECQLNFTALPYAECAKQNYSRDQELSPRPVLLNCQSCAGGAAGAGVTRPPSSCKEVKFVAFRPHPSKSRYFLNHSSTTSAADCALQCYQRRCTVAGFMNPPPEEHVTGQCLFSYNNPEDCEGVAKVSSHVAPGDVQIQCVECTAYESGGIHVPIIPIPVPVPGAAASTSVAPIVVQNVTSAAITPTAVVTSAATPAITSSAAATSLTPTEVANSTVIVNATTAPVFLEEGNTTTALPTNIIALATTSAANVTSVQRTCGKTIFYQTRKPTDFGPANEKLQITRAKNLEECAKNCYEAGCVRAFFTPHDHDSFLCELSFNNIPFDCATNRSIYTWNATLNEQVQILCVTCDQFPIVANQFVGNNPNVALVTGGNVFNFTKNVVDKNRKECGVIFEVVEETQGGKIAQYFTAVSSVAECAKQCYIYECSAAYYLPISTPINQARCSLFFENRQCHNQSNRYAYYSAGKPLKITCVACIEKLSDYFINQHETGAASFVTLAVTTNPVTGELNAVEYKPTRTCSGITSFEVNSVAIVTSLELTKEFTAKTAYECALACYQDPKCTSVKFSNEDKQFSLPAYCLLFFMPSESPCLATANRTSNYTEDKVVQLQCIQCGAEHIDATATVIEKNVNETVPVTIGTTIKYVFGGGFEGTNGNLTTPLLQTNVPTILTTLIENRDQGLSTVTYKKPQPNVFDRIAGESEEVSSARSAEIGVNSGGLVRASSERSAENPELKIGINTLVPVILNGKSEGKGVSDVLVTGQSIATVTNPVAGVGEEVTTTITTKGSPPSSPQATITITTAAPKTEPNVVPVESNATFHMTSENGKNVRKDANFINQQGASGCRHRVMFQVQPAVSSLSLKFTTDVKVGSAAECAQVCYNRSCEVAEYIPPPEGRQSGICLLSDLKRQCVDVVPRVFQEYRSFPFIINCIECSPCSFTLRVPPDPNSLPSYDQQVDALSMLECAQKCWSVRCTSAAYTAKSHKGNCLLSTPKATQGVTSSITNTQDQQNSDCLSNTVVSETRVDTNINVPVIMDCVRCN